MFEEFLGIVQEFFKKLFSSRLFALSVISIVMFAGLVGKLFRMQILDGSDYQEKYMQKTERGVDTPGTRDKIYDCNGYELAYDKLAYPVVIQDMGDHSRPADRNKMLYRLVTILERRGETVEGKFETAMDRNGEMIFISTSESAKTRFLLNFYGRSSSAKLDDPKGKYSRNVTAGEISETKKHGYKPDKVKDDKGGALIFPDKIALDMVNIIYTMKLAEYQKYETTTVAVGISNETMTEINENIADLKGVSVEQSSVRKYNDSSFFAPIIGYTGKVQEDQLDELNEQWRHTSEAAGLPQDSKKYDLNDIVGRTGIEKSMELELQGEKGYSRMYVDNAGRPREIIEKTDAKAGDDAHPTIDRDLQIAIYELIEQQLAGVITYWLRNEDVDPLTTTNSFRKKIPIKDAYYQLINNSALSLPDMAREDILDIEKEIYSTYVISRNQILTNIRNELMSAHVMAMNDLSKDMSTYVNYIYTFLSDSSIGVIQEDRIDQSSPEYQARKGGSISLRDYIYSGIAGSWVDITRLDVSSRYPDTDDIFGQLVDHVIEFPKTDNKFTKRMFCYPVNGEAIAGNQLCLALFSQDALGNNLQETTALRTGDSTYTPQLVREKTSNLDLTSAQLALDPCTAGVVVTDMRTGEVKVLVTYPSYGNNPMLGSVDVVYSAQLQGDMSKPLYDNAAQAQKAPGSTFKPITAVAALEEGVIGLQDTVECTGIYDQVSNPIRRWIYPGRHGSENIGEDTQNFYNYLFAELVHRLCIKPDGTYSPEQGLDTLYKYAAMFEPDHTSRVEIPENESQISTKDPERPAMGQGTHPYTNVQLPRHVVAVANKGTAFELGLLNKFIDFNDDLIADYASTASSHIETSDSTWSAVQTGMRRVITDSSAKSIFSDLSVEVAGKAGTAQEDRARSNHAFFVPFVPYSHPEVAVIVNIPYGYAGTNTATLGEKVHEYYYRYTTLDQTLDPGALGVSNVNIGD